MGRPKKIREPARRAIKRPPRIGRPVYDSKGKDVTDIAVEKILKTLNRDTTKIAVDTFREPIRQLLIFLSGQIYRRSVAQEAMALLRRYTAKGLAQSPLWPFLELLNPGDPLGLSEEIQQQIRQALDWDTQFIVGSFLPAQYFYIFGKTPKAGKPGGDRSLDSEMVKFIAAVASVCRIQVANKTILDAIGRFHKDNCRIGFWAQSEKTP